MVYTYIIKHKKKPRFPEGGGKGEPRFPLLGSLSLTWGRGSFPMYS